MQSCGSGKRPACWQTNGLSVVVVDGSVELGPAVDSVVELEEPSSVAAELDSVGSCGASSVVEGLPALEPSVVSGADVEEDVSSLGSLVT